MARSPSAKAANSASGTRAAISAPVKSAVSSATASTSTVSGDLPAPLRAAPTISTRSPRVGRSTQNTSSNLPLRRNSGGRARTSFAVATMKTGAVFSCIHDRIVPSASALTPPSAAPWVAPASAFSTSSSQRMQGATASATESALRRLPSDSPTHLLRSAPTSMRSSGMP